MKINFKYFRIVDVEFRSCTLLFGNLKFQESTKFEQILSKFTNQIKCMHLKWINQFVRILPHIICKCAYLPKREIYFLCAKSTHVLRHN